MYPLKKEKEINYIPYYLKVYEADSLYIIGEYERSYTILDSLFKSYEPLDLPIYQEYVTYNKLKIVLKIRIKRSEFSELFSKHGYTREYIENDSLLNSYYNKNKKYFDNNFSGLRKNYLSSLNLELRKTILEMKQQDQLYRKKEYKNHLEEQERIDSLNTVKLITIFNTLGYPNEKLIGNFSIDNTNSNISAILLHTKDSIRVNYFMPKILEYVKKGQASPRDYATMQDQYFLYNGEEQYYGTYTTKEKITVPVSELNRRRKTIGLPNYDYENWRTKKLFSEYY